MYTIEKLFLDEEYKVIDLKKEYAGATGFVGTERYAIVSKHNEEYLLTNFSQELAPYEPFVVISVEMYEAIKCNNANDEREHLRHRRYHEPFTVESLIHLIDQMSDPIQICETIYNLECISARMLELPDHQGSRIYKKYILGLSTKEIAISEGVSKQTIRRSLRLGKAKIHDLFVEMGVVA